MTKQIMWYLNRGSLFIATTTLLFFALIWTMSVIDRETLAENSASFEKPMMIANRVEYGIIDDSTANHMSMELALEELKGMEYYAVDNFNRDKLEQAGTLAMRLDMTGLDTEVSSGHECAIFFQSCLMHQAVNCKSNFRYSESIAIARLNAVM